MDGEEFDVPEEEVNEAGGVRAYQREKASEKRLAAARQTLEESRRMMAQLLEAQKPQEAPVSDVEFLKARLDKVRFGTDEEAVSAFQEVIGRVAKPVDVNALIAQTTEKWRHDTAIESFAKANADILSDPTLGVLAHALQQQGMEQLRKTKAPGPVDWNGFYSTIATQIRNATGRHSQPPGVPAPATTGTAPSPTSPVSDKEARKASIVTLPTAAARAVAPAEPKPETREDILSEMRNSRMPTG
ncbi:MAG: hypothetical protein FJX76_01425 [Armatimonadetes bacterium]|nr:hypothetical protein [Armatimonadota bacterium]